MAYQQTEDEKDLEYAYFGIFDGHGGREAAVYAKEHLMDHIVRQKGFWSDDDDTVLRAIHEGFVSTHHAMWRELGKDFVRTYNSNGRSKLNAEQKRRTIGSLQTPKKAPSCIFI